MSKIPELHILANRKPNYDAFQVTVLRYHYEDGHPRAIRTEYLDPVTGWTEYEEMHGEIRPAFEITGMDFRYNTSLHSAVKSLIDGDDRAVAAVRDAAELGVRRVLLHHA